MLALIKVFGEAGLGFFPGPAAIEAEIKRQYHVRAVGRRAGFSERFYAASVERRLKHPAVVAISEEAKHRLFIGGARRQAGFEVRSAARTPFPGRRRA